MTINEEQKMYAVRVTFYNNDFPKSESGEWTRDYILNKEPNKKWLKSLYDGVNEPQQFVLLGVVVAAKKNHTAVVCCGNIVKLDDLNEGGMPDHNGTIELQGTCPTCEHMLNLNISKEEL